MDKFSDRLDNQRDNKYREVFRKFLLTDKSLSLPQRIIALRSKVDFFLTEVADEFQLTINPYLQTVDYKSCEQKKEVAKTINAQAAHLGLAIKCPKTGYPSYLIADGTGDPDVGRFQFRTMDTTSGRGRTLTAIKLPELAFMPAISSRRRSINWVSIISEDVAKDRGKN